MKGEQAGSFVADATHVALAAAISSYDIGFRRPSSALESDVANQEFPFSHNNGQTQKEKELWLATPSNLANRNN